MTLPADTRAAAEQAIAEAFKRMAPDDYKPVPDRPVPMDSASQAERDFFRRDFYEEARDGTKPWPVPLEEKE